MKAEELLFVLDIGTRSVIGVVGKVCNEMLEVLCVESEDHSARAVVDGQIEDIEQTAKVAGRVKARIEETLGITLKEVHVAAAGRVLKTERTTCEIELDNQNPIDAKEVTALEVKAVQQAYENLVQGLRPEEPSDFCTVGHTVVGYKLDGYTFSTLLGHRGRRAEVELIATFLPSEVVESLYTTMSLLGLSIASMTMEPIAAMNAVVPQELRLLNVALVDVGAGTSDIAIVDKGSVRGYTMATIAGDEVTERLMQEFLVDFSTAERMKFDASARKQSIEYVDVLGLSYAVELDELLERVQPTIEELAHKIADGILAVNGDAPKAVFMVGGGSRTPGLCKLVAQALDIDEKRVAIGGNNYMKRQVQADEKYLSAEYATPVGIGVTAMAAVGGESMSVSINGVRLHLTGQAMTVMEALRLGGYQYGQIMGRSGKSIVFEYNGERRIIRGELPTLAEIRVNGELAGLSELLQAGDEISFTPATDGKDAAPLLKDVAVNWNPFVVNLFGEDVMAGTRAWINDLMSDGDSPVRQMDKVVVDEILTIGQLLKTIGGEGQENVLTINGMPCTGPHQKLNPEDRIELNANETIVTAAPQDAEKQSADPPQAVQTDQEPKPDFPPLPPDENGKIRILFNGQHCVLTPKEGGYQLFTLLNYVDIDPNEPHGEIVLLRNGVQGSYLEQIKDGDQIEIHWSQEQPMERIPHIPQYL